MNKDTGSLLQICYCLSEGDIYLQVWTLAHIQCMYDISGIIQLSNYGKTFVFKVPVCFILRYNCLLKANVDCGAFILKYRKIVFLVNLTNCVCESETKINESFQGKTNDLNSL